MCVICTLIVSLKSWNYFVGETLAPFSYQEVVKRLTVSSYRKKIYFWVGEFGIYDHNIRVIALSPMRGHPEMKSNDFRLYYSLHNYHYVL